MNKYYKMVIHFRQVFKVQKYSTENLKNFSYNIYIYFLKSKYFREISVVSMTPRSWFHTVESDSAVSLIHRVRKKMLNSIIDEKYLQNFEPLHKKRF